MSHDTGDMLIIKDELIPNSPGLFKCNRAVVQSYFRTHVKLHLVCRPAARIVV